MERKKTHTKQSNIADIVFVYCICTELKNKDDNRKKNPHNGVMLNFLCFFVLFNAVKTDTKLTLHHMGKIFII